MGETFDIHGGGLDLEFPHHENEIAQSECCHDRPDGYLLGSQRPVASATPTQQARVGGRADREDASEREPGDQRADDAGGKMSAFSKGAGGLAELHWQRQGGERIRFFLLRTHYRSTVLFSEPAIEEAGVGLEGFYRLFKRYDPYHWQRLSTQLSSSPPRALKASPPLTGQEGRHAIDAATGLSRQVPYRHGR